MQMAYGRAEAAGSETDWLEVTSRMQERVVREVGVPSERQAAALWLLRSAASLWPDDDELRAVSCWVRHNRARAGDLSEGDLAPDLPLFPLTDEAALASSSAATAISSVRHACAGKPTLLVAGSFT